MGALQGAGEGGEEWTEAEPALVEVEEVELLEGTLLGEEGLLEAGEVEEAAWTEVGEVEAGVSTLIFHHYPWQTGGVDIDFEMELSNLLNH